MKPEVREQLQRETKNLRAIIRRNERWTAFHIALAIASLTISVWGVYSFIWMWNFISGIAFFLTGIFGTLSFGTIASYPESVARGAEIELQKIEIKLGKQKPRLATRVLGWFRR